MASGEPVNKGRGAGNRFMLTDEKKPLRKLLMRVMLATVILLPAVGGVAFYLLGRVDPQDAATVNLAWGDRVERRLDALIDGSRPKWADRVEDRLDALLDKVGWD